MKNEHSLATIEKTFNYDLFKKHPLNREIKQSNLKSLIKSFEQINMLAFNPIIVNPNMEILDGQHRLEVAKQLNLEVYYIVCPVDFKNCIYLLQTQKTWELEDYLEFYVKQNNENYIKLKTFVEKNNLSIDLSCKILSKDAGKGLKIVDFKSGKFVFPKDLSKTNEIIKDYLFIKDKITTPPFYNANIIKAKSNFQKALIEFTLRSDFNVDLFLKNLYKKSELFKNYGSSYLYYTFFLKIYEN